MGLVAARRRIRVTISSTHWSSCSPVAHEGIVTTSTPPVIRAPIVFWRRALRTTFTTNGAAGASAVSPAAGSASLASPGSSSANRGSTRATLQNGCRVFGDARVVVPVAQDESLLEPATGQVRDADRLPAEGVHDQMDHAAVGDDEGHAVAPGQRGQGRLHTGQHVHVALAVGWPLEVVAAGVVPAQLAGPCEDFVSLCGANRSRPGEASRSRAGAVSGQGPPTRGGE